MNKSIYTLVVLCVLLFAPHWALAQKGHIKLASATTTENSGLYTELLPLFTQQTEIEVRVLSVGTGQAINIAQSGDAEVLLVHHKPSEDQFVKNGYGERRHNLMYNDFVLVGPKHDPAKILGMKDASQALNKIFQTNSPFVSRGDASGTHQKELSFWKSAGIDIVNQSGKWYLESGSGMGATLNVVRNLRAYTLVDRGTWLRYSGRDGLQLMVESDPELFNQYSVILVNPAVHPHINAEEGRVFLKWLLSSQGQSAINNFKINGEQAFFANAEG